MKKVSLHNALISFFFFANLGGAQVLGHSAKEVNVAFKAEFRTELKVFDDPVYPVISGVKALKEYRGKGSETAHGVDMPQNLPVWISDLLWQLVEMHVSHIFGLGVSPERIKAEGLPKGRSGFASLRLPFNYKFLKFRVDPQDPNFTYIQYSASGKILAHKEIAADWLKIVSGNKRVGTSFPLPFDWDQAYDQKCTDEHYSGLGDYWYFWNPYQQECKYLLKAPYTKNVVVTVTPAPQKSPDTLIRLDALRGDNQNGRTFEITAIHGFEDESATRNDEGRAGHNHFLEYLDRLGFRKRIAQEAKFKEHAIYEKELDFPGAPNTRVVIESVLVDTDISTESNKAKGIKSDDFAQFFKQAVHYSDVIYYGGHSGLGANLNIPSLEEKLGANDDAFEFDLLKKQIFFFDSCSSYSYYLNPFRADKSNKSIDIISYGLSSQFGSSPKILENFMDYLLSTRRTDGKWMDLLKKMEEPLNYAAPVGQDSWLLNVGGI